MEAVLPTLCSNVSQVYYKRKLSCYKYSVYSLGDRKGYCYLWNESEGQRGGHLTFNNYFTYFYIYKNHFVATALMQALKSNPNLQCIDQKFLEPGHTQMEDSDSMHAAIENAKRKTSVNIPSQWDTIVWNARKTPYTVVPVKPWDIVDYKAIAKKDLKNVAIGINGQRVQWRKIKHFRFTKEDPNKIYFKYRFADEEFSIIKERPSRRGRPGWLVGWLFWV